MTTSVRSPASIPARAGIGLRFAHHEAVRAEPPDVGWLEVHSENYFGGGSPLAHLEAIRARYPISLHGVGLSLGSADALDARHLHRVAELVRRIEPALVSEHLAWSTFEGRYFADLLPLPFTEESLEVVCRNVERVQETLGREILLENASACLRYRHSILSEWEFLGEIARRTGCGILCDVNNIAVSASNLGFNARRYLTGLPREHVAEIHLAGHQLRLLPDGRSIRIDDHGSRVSDEVWGLYREALTLFGPVPTLIEWDTNIPPLEDLLDEAAKADAILSNMAVDNAVPA